MVKPTLTVLEACSPPSPKGRAEREIRMGLNSETNTEKQRTEVLQRKKIIICISAFGLISTLIVIGIVWFKISQGMIPATKFAIFSGCPFVLGMRWRRKNAVSR